MKRVMFTFLNLTEFPDKVKFFIPSLLRNSFCRRSLLFCTVVILCHKKDRNILDHEQLETRLWLLYAIGTHGTSLVSVTCNYVDGTHERVR